jgi:alpha-L-fucosidase
MNTLLAVLLTAAAQFEPNWESLDTRPNPAWFEEAKFGIFIHWGVYSVPAWGPKDRYAEWYWHDMQDKNGETWKFHERVYGADFDYRAFAPMFRAELFDPAEWADLIAASGAKYVVLTSKHHEGFSLWPDPHTPGWNAAETGPKRDLAGDLTAAVRARGLKMGFYYSMYEWFNPLYHEDVNRYVDEYMLPQMKDLVQRYQPDLFWPDGEWDHPSAVWRSTEFLAWLFNESAAPKDIAVNDRWGKETRNLHGGFATPEYGHLPEGRLVAETRFEECQGMGKSFGYNRNEGIDSYRTPAALTHLLVDNVSRGGNLLLDIGPTADGRIPVIMQQRLKSVGRWLEVNGEAIHGSNPWPAATPTETVRYTRKGETGYAISFTWPGAELLVPRPGDAPAYTATLLGLPEAPITVTEAEGGLLRLTLPCIDPDAFPSPHAYTFRLSPAG